MRIVQLERNDEGAFFENFVDDLDGDASAGGEGQAFQKLTGGDESWEAGVHFGAVGEIERF